MFVWFSLFLLGLQRESGKIGGIMKRGGCRWGLHVSCKGQFPWTLVRIAEDVSCPQVTAATEVSTVCSVIISTPSIMETWWTSEHAGRLRSAVWCLSDTGVGGRKGGWSGEEGTGGTNKPRTKVAGFHRSMRRADCRHVSVNYSPVCVRGVWVGWWAGQTDTASPGAACLYSPRWASLKGCLNMGQATECMLHKV